MYLSSNGLDWIANATTVRVRNGKRLTTDGPFAETHEQADLLRRMHRRRAAADAYQRALALCGNSAERA